MPLSPGRRAPPRSTGPVSLISPAGQRGGVEEQVVVRVDDPEGRDGARPGDADDVGLRHAGSPALTWACMVPGGPSRSGARSRVWRRRTASIGCPFWPMTPMDGLRPARMVDGRDREPSPAGELRRPMTPLVLDRPPTRTRWGGRPAAARPARRAALDRPGDGRPAGGRARGARRRQRRDDLVAEPVRRERLPLPGPVRERLHRGRGDDHAQHDRGARHRGRRLRVDAQPREARPGSGEPPGHALDPGVRAGERHAPVGVARLRPATAGGTRSTRSAGARTR